MTKADFEEKLKAITSSVPGFEGSVDFTEKRSSCGAWHYKVGMGLPGPSLLEVRHKVTLAIQGAPGPIRTVDFDVEEDALSPHYGKTYVRVRHMHFDNPPSRPLPAPSSKKFVGLDLQVERVVKSGTTKVVIFKPHWPEEGNFGVPIKYLHHLLNKDGQILINHQDCTHEGIDKIIPGDFVTLPELVR